LVELDGKIAVFKWHPSLRTNLSTSAQIFPPLYIFIEIKPFIFNRLFYFSQIFPPLYKSFHLSWRLLT
jgi:hypothetical protein